MFRSLFRTRRTIRVPIEDSGHQVREVRVFRKALTRPSNFVTTFFIAYFVFRILETYTIGDSATTQDGVDKRKQDGDGKRQQQSQDQGLSEHWRKAHEAILKADLDAKRGTSTNSDTPSPQRIIGASTPDSAISTITLPVWIRAKKSPLYAPTDQEYKDYVRIQSDKKKMAELKNQVTQWALSRLENPAHEVNLKHIGYAGHVHVRLDLVPQLHPPPLYEVPALILFRDGVAVGWKTLRPDLGTRMESMFHPRVTYAAAKASLGAFFHTSYAISKARFLGGSGVTIVGIPKTKVPNSVMSDKELEKDNAIPSMSNWPANFNTQTMQELLRAVHTGQNTRDRHTELIKNLPFSVAVQFAAATFKRKQLIGLAQAQQRRARGVLQIRGTVVCIGDRGQYRMEVIAFYLPSEDKFLGPLVIHNAYMVKDYSQWQKLEDERMKALRQSRGQNVEKGSAKSSREEDHPTASTPKPPSGKEKE